MRIVAAASMAWMAQAADDCTQPTQTAGYIITPNGDLTFSDDFAVTVACQSTGYTLTNSGTPASATKCSSAGTEYVLSGCTADDCTTPTDTTGYTITAGGDVTFSSAFAVTVACEHSGTPSATKCSTPGTDYVLSGCPATADTVPTPTPPVTPAPPPTAEPEQAVAAQSSACDNVDAPRAGGTCYGNVTWAMETGLSQHPAYYYNYTHQGSKYYVGVPTNRLDMQCILWHMREGTHTVSAADADNEAQAGEGHACPIPCTTNFTTICAPPTTPTTSTTTLLAAESGGIPWWVWPLLAVLVLLCCFAAYMMQEEKKAPKKKRALKVVPPPPPAPPVPLQPQPVMTYVQHPRPVQTHTVMVPVAQPMVTTAPPVYIQAPQQIQYVQQVQQEVQYVQPPSMVPRSTSLLGLARSLLGLTTPYAAPAAAAPH